MTISIIAAMSENRVIGRDGGLPWHLPDDMKRFKELTAGHTVIMGRKTWESLPGGKPLPNRRNIVLSRDPELAPEGVEVARALDEAIELAGDDDEIFIAGGAAVYEAALPRSDRMYLTIVHAEVEGDTFFPEFEMSRWRLVSEECHTAHERQAHAFTVRVFARES